MDEAFRKSYFAACDRGMSKIMFWKFILAFNENYNL